jgi:hypothetical protein
VGATTASHPDLQRALAEGAGQVVERETSHASVLSRPDRVVGLLDGLATG